MDVRTPRAFFPPRKLTVSCRQTEVDATGAFAFLTFSTEIQDERVERTGKKRPVTFDLHVHSPQSDLKKTKGGFLAAKLGDGL